MKINGKAAIVTGGGTGVGKATSLMLAQGGCAVVINYSRSKEDADQTVEEIKAAGGQAIAVQGNVSKDDTAQRLVQGALESFGRLDVLINCAGTTEFIPFGDLDRVTEDVWQKIMAVNLIGPFQCARAAAPAMRETAKPEGGVIVNVSSTAALLANGSSIPYAASKAALNNLTVSLARTFAPEIRVNAVAPGFIDSRWVKNALGEKYEKGKATISSNLPLGRVCQPEDVAAAIVGFVTGSDLVTGQIQVCDSGMLIIDPLGKGALE
ncbi:Glucose 1-dehydrogenase 4 [Planctomycetes bacterium Pan216]|uniref:Glucose 1-dehydrogenase 4 n=1 Tax=Kolteria novifilia TaxID=2527975 RepID=A0A518AXR2_9BACT|nr:Glucose 1-dehydrogenase 4 [Planctomycetes bacterium Pan216]